jgi:hypothetical protein
MLMRKVMSKTIQLKFERYIANNPHVIDVYLKFAREVKARGFQRYGIGALTERVRWHYQMEIVGGEKFKICNSYRSRIARYLMTVYPDLAGFFRVRLLRSA